MDSLDMSTNEQFPNKSVDNQLLQRYVDHVTQKKQSTSIPPTYQADVELLHLLQQANAPLSMYDQIQRWARKSYAINHHIFIRNNLPRPKVLKLIEKQLVQEDAIPNLPLCFFQQPSATLSSKHMILPMQFTRY
jgi:hypothetical protein